MGTPDSSTALRRLVDQAVDPTYDRAFRIADVLDVATQRPTPERGAAREVARLRRALRDELARLGEPIPQPIEPPR